MMETAVSFEMLVHLSQTAQFPIPEDYTLQAYLSVVLCLYCTGKNHLVSCFHFMSRFCSFLFFVHCTVLCIINFPVHFLLCSCVGWINCMNNKCCSSGKR